MYLDPGFGSMIIQFALAGIAVIGAVFFTMKGKIKAFFAKKKGLPVEDAQGDEDDDIEVPGGSGEAKQNAEGTGEHPVGK